MTREPKDTGAEGTPEPKATAGASDRAGMGPLYVVAAVAALPSDETERPGRLGLAFVVLSGLLVVLGAAWLAWWALPGGTP